MSNHAAGTDPDPTDPLTGLLGDSVAAERIRDFARRAAGVDAPVLLAGESGTGKGMVARAIHFLSARRRGPFVPVNCAGVPETLLESEFFGHARGAFTGAHHAHRGLLEQADRGTLFLDEIAELPLQSQAKLLTALDDGEFRRLGAERTIRSDARLIAATNGDLARAVRERRFRADLFHRLAVLAFRIPPLRERDGDVDLFLRRFLAEFAERHRRPVRGFDPGTYARLRHHPWPGNVRQLRHAVEAAVLTCDADRIRTPHLPFLLLDGDPTAPADPAPAPATERYSFYGSPDEERRHILAVLRRCRGNRTRAAAQLGMSRNTLRAKLRAASDTEPEPRTPNGRHAARPGRQPEP